MSAPIPLPVVAGHRKSLAFIEDTAAYHETRRLYAEALGGVEVYLRLTGKGFTVISLDERAPQVIGVGGPQSGQCDIWKLPPPVARVQKQAAEYAAKLATASGSAEERYSVELLRGALSSNGGGNLSLGPSGLYFIHQEWRFTATSTRIDILAADPAEGRLVVIELKESEQAARTESGKKFGDAWEQAHRYAALLHEQRVDLYPFFQSLGRALAVAHDAPDEMKSLVLQDVEPRILVGWPGGEFAAEG